MDAIGDIVLAAILVANGDLSLHVERLPDRPTCLARIAALKAEGLRVHHADCTSTIALGLTASWSPPPAAPPIGGACFTFNGERICE